MRRDHGTIAALGAVAALAGLASIGGRSHGSRRRRESAGSWNTGELVFIVKPRVILRCPPFEAMHTKVSIPWDGDPATMPTRQQVLEAWRQAQTASDDQSAKDVAWEVAFNRLREEPDEWADFSIDDPDTWHIQPVVEVRRGLGGRKHLTAGGYSVTMEQVNSYQSATHDELGKQR